MSLSLLDRLRARRDVASAPVFDGLAQVRGYWEGLRSAGQLPERAALDPRGLSGMLDRVFLGERIGKGLIQLRIAGSGLADFAGIDVRGLPISCLFAPESRQGLALAVETVFHTPAVAELDLTSDRAGGGALVARLILLPLADEAGRKLVLGALSWAGQTAPRCKLQIQSRRYERILLAPPPSEELPQIEATTVAPIVEPIRRFGHLSLVHSAD